MLKANGKVSESIKYLPKSEAIRDDDIGVENAAIRGHWDALTKVHGNTKSALKTNITMDDLNETELVGGQQALWKLGEHVYELE